MLGKQPRSEQCGAAGRGATIAKARAGRGPHLVGSRSDAERAEQAGRGVYSATARLRDSGEAMRSECKRSEATKKKGPAKGSRKLFYDDKQ